MKRIALLLLLPLLLSSCGNSTPSSNTDSSSYIPDYKVDSLSYTLHLTKMITESKNSGEQWVTIDEKDDRYATYHSTILLDNAELFEDNDLNFLWYLHYEYIAIDTRYPVNINVSYLVDGDINNVSREYPGYTKTYQISYEKEPSTFNRHLDYSNEPVIYIEPFYSESKAAYTWIRNTGDGVLGPLCTFQQSFIKIDLKEIAKNCQSNVRKYVPLVTVDCHVKSCFVDEDIYDKIGNHDLIKSSDDQYLSIKTFLQKDPRFSWDFTNNVLPLNIAAILLFAAYENDYVCSCSQYRSIDSYLGTALPFHGYPLPLINTK